MDVHFGNGGEFFLGLIVVMHLFLLANARWASLAGSRTNGEPVPEGAIETARRVLPQAVLVQLAAFALLVSLIVLGGVVPFSWRVEFGAAGIRELPVGVPYLRPAGPGFSAGSDELTVIARLEPGGTFAQLENFAPWPVYILRAGEAGAWGSLGQVDGVPEALVAGIERASERSGAAVRTVARGETFWPGGPPSGEEGPG